MTKKYEDFENSAKFWICDNVYVMLMRSLS